MICTKTLNEKTFLSTLLLIPKNGGTLSDNVQNCCMYAMDAFSQCVTVGNECQKLSELRNVVRNTRGANTSKFDAYVLEHCNVEAAVNSNKEFIFKVKAGEIPHVKTPQVMWDAHKSVAKVTILTEEVLIKDLVKKGERGISTATVEAIVLAQMLAAYAVSTECKNALTKAITERKIAADILEAKRIDRANQMKANKK